MMNYIQIGNINLQYDESITDIERILRIIKLNRFLFEDYMGKTISLVKENLSDNNIVYVTNFDEFFDNLLKQLLNDTKFIFSLNQPELLPALYIQLLVKEESKNGETFIQVNDNITDDMLWFIIACKFFNCKNQFDELSNFLKKRNDKEHIFGWLKQTQRFNTYNYILELALNTLKEYDFYFYNNIDEIFSKMNEKNFDYAISSKNSSYKLQKISLEDLENIFFGYLDKIKAPKEWENIYIDLKNNDRIIFEECKDGKDKSEWFIDDDGIKKIKVTTDGTIKVFISFVHEFIHYISLQKNRPPFSLLEFPSIYYERAAAIYLIDIGFDKNIIKSVIENRNKNNFGVYYDLFGLLLDICRYNKKGNIIREEKIELLKNATEKTNECIENLINISLEEGNPIDDLQSLIIKDCDYGKKVDNECDYYIMQFIKKGVLVLDGYQYLTDSYLADSVLEKEDDDTILDKMVFITENLSNFNIKTISKYLGIEDTFIKKSKRKNLTNKKI